MKIKMGSELKQADGIRAITNSETQKNMTLRDVCINALLTPQKDENEKDKYSDYELFKKIRDGGADVDLKTEEVVHIKKKIGLIYPALILGQAYDLLEKIDNS